MSALDRGMLELLWITWLFASASPTYGLAGVVRDVHTRKPVADALVVLRCTCLQQERETMTDARGVYRFRQLPAGEYGVKVLTQEVSVEKIIRLGPRPSAMATRAGAPALLEVSP